MLLSCLFLGWTGYAQDDHLMPERGYFSSYPFQNAYYSQIRHILLDSLSDRFVVRIVVVPSFSPEYVLSIKQGNTNSAFVLVHRTASRSIWSEQFRAKNYETIRVNEQRKNLPQPLASHLIKLFGLAVNQTRYPEQRSLGTDGTNYYVTVDNFGWRGGYTWSPRQGSLMDKLVSIVEQLTPLTLNDQPVEFIEKLSTDAQTLYQDLQKVKY